MSAHLREAWATLVREGDVRWTPGLETAKRCTEVTLNQFGIFNKRPREGAGILLALQKKGWKFRTVVGRLGTVKEFCENHQQGDYVVCTHNHAMALRDGLLADSEQLGPDGRVVYYAYEIYRDDGTR